jgi:hypothetical protein
MQWDIELPARSAKAGCPMSQALTVLSLFVVAWAAVWYAARMWDVPAEFSHTPTYSGQARTPAK